MYTKSGTPMEQPNPAQIACSQQAFKLIQAGAIERGKELLAQAEQMGDTCSVALHLIAKAAYELGDRSKAIALLQRAVELDPANAGALVELGICLKENGERAAGEDVLQQALWIYGLTLATRVPSGTELYNLGVAYLELGDKAQALELFKQALESPAGLESTLHQRAKILACDPARHDVALAIWDLILQHNPCHLDALCNRAKMLISFGDLEQAIPLLESVLQVRPQERWPHELLAFTHSIRSVRAMTEHLELLRSYWANRKPTSSETEPPASPQSAPDSQQRNPHRLCDTRTGARACGESIPGALPSERQTGAASRWS